MNLKLTPEDITAIEQREPKVSPGPWRYSACYGVATIEAPDNVPVAHAVEYIDYHDADFIATSRTDIPNLVHDWRVLSQRVQELEKVLRDVAYLPDGMNTFDAVVAAREVLNKK